MRRFFAGIFVFFASFALASPAATQDCPACTYFEALRPAGGSALFDQFLARLASRPGAVVMLASGAFCQTGPGADLTADLIRSADDQFARLNAITARINECPDACAPAVNEADYCAYGARLVVDRYRLGAIGLRLAELGRVYERAATEELPPIQILAAELTRHGGAALAVLGKTQQMLANGEMGESPDVEWDGSATEVTGLFDAVTMLADFSLLAGDVSEIENGLKTAARQINFLRNELQVIARRDRPPDTREILAIERRLLIAASELAYVMASLQGSAAATQVSDESAADARRAAVCMNQLSISATDGSEAPGQLDKTLSACRSFNACGDQASINVPPGLSPLDALLQDRTEAANQSRILTESICGGQ